MVSGLGTVSQAASAGDSESEVVSVGARGKKSFHALSAAVEGLPPLKVERLQPPKNMPADEKAIWKHLTESMPADWFGPEHLVPLTEYCDQAVRAAELKKQ